MITEVLAVLGATAWAPQVYKLIAKAVRRPKVTISPASSCALGYSTSGPQIQVHVLLCAFHKDALIEKMELVAMHESGEQRRLTWMNLLETMGEFRLPDGVGLTMGKSQPAMGLAVGTISSIDRHIMFSDPEFTRRLQPVTSVLDAAVRFLRQRDEYSLEAIAKLREFADLRDFYKDNLYWKQGEWRIELKAYARGVSKPHRETLTLSVSRFDMESIESNLPIIEHFVQSSYEPTSGGPPRWKWTPVPLARPDGLARAEK